MRPSKNLLRSRCKVIEHICTRAKLIFLIRGAFVRRWFAIFNLSNYEVISSIIQGLAEANEILVWDS